MGVARVLGVNVSASLREHRGAVVLILLLGLAAVTHDPFADGPLRLYAIQLARQSLSIIALYVFGCWLQRQSHTVLSRLAMALVFSVTLALVLQHVVRLFHPARWGVMYAELADDFSGPVIAEGRWMVLGDDASSIRVWGETLHLVPPPATLSFVELLLPSNPTFPGGERWLPAGLYADHMYEEELTWHGSAHVEREYFIVLMWDPLLIQRTPYGLHVTYPKVTGGLEGHQIGHAFPEPPQPHTWRIRRSSGRISLAVDGQVVWSAAAGQEHLNQMPRFGESRTDELHAGWLTLDWVRYRRWLPREFHLVEDTVLTRINQALGGRLDLEHLVETD